MRVRRILLLTSALLATATVPAYALDAPAIDIGVAAAAAGAPIGELGTLVVERIGTEITVTARFSRRPPGRRVSLCLDVAGDRRCVHRRARRNLTLKLERSADFTAPLRATARSAGAVARLSL